MHEPVGTNDAPDQELTVAGVDSPWASWADVPRDVELVKARGPFFLEIFSGTANLTKAVRQAGIATLPPIDITPCSEVPVQFDVLDADNWSFIMALIHAGAIRFVHCGTPCNTFSAARKLDGGPPPLRSVAFPEGLTQLSSDNHNLVLMGNLFLDRSVEACLGVFDQGGNFSIENPEQSLLWATKAVQRLVHLTRAFRVSFDQCEFGAESVKPTSFLTSHEALRQLERRCQGGHQHVRLKGRVWSDFFNAWVFRTKLAQVYPEKLCAEFASELQLFWPDRGLQFVRSFLLASKDRKRPLGQPLRWKEHRQALSALKAEAAGYQLKRGARKPLLHIETEPGVAIAWALDIPHPLCQELSLDTELEHCIRSLGQSPSHTQAVRLRQLEHWQHRATALLPQTEALIMQQPDVHLRRLLRGAPDGQPCQLGQTCHIALYYEMLQACQSVDRYLPDLLLQGFPIVGPIARSQRWPSFDKEQTVLSIEHACARAWGIRNKIISRVQSVPVSDNLQKIWEATLEDVTEGSTLGPFGCPEKISEFLGCEDWIPTQRFEVVQRNKVRGCDSATTNLINQITRITEKLQLPSTDTNVAALRKLRSLMPEASLAGWVLDERKAYRQVAIQPAQRKFSVICLKNPSSGKPNFFVMIGHSFGLVSSVYNYNRRSAAINEICLKLFNLVSFNFYDDKYGFEPLESVDSAFEVAQRVHWWLGAAFDRKKLQLTRTPTILGVTYNLEGWLLEIKSDRKEELVDEISGILKADMLEPGLAGKLKGKLMFGASQLWGKVGRAFLRAISERQYLRVAENDRFGLEPPLRESLKQWLRLVRSGPPRTIDLCACKKADAVLFTDGFSPDPRDHDCRPDRIGAVLFDRRLCHPLQFSEVVPKAVKDCWLARQTQIVPVEMIAPIVALTTFEHRLFRADLLVFTDSEVVEAALVKGYSAKEDLCLLISVFWDLICKLQIRVFIDRVATDANPADAPSRDDLNFGRSVGWRTVRASWPSQLARD